MNIILLHRDLRMHDNPALFHGTNAEEALVVYVYDKKYWQGNGKSTFQLKFGMDCLKEVSNNLKNRNIPLHVFEGNYEKLKNWIEVNFPKSVIYMNHFTDIGYYRNDTNVFKRFYADQKRIKYLLDNSLMMVTALAPKIGYDKAASIAKLAYKNGTTLKEEVIKEGLIKEREYEKIMNPLKMTKPK